MFGGLPTACDGRERYVNGIRTGSLFSLFLFLLFRLCWFCFFACFFFWCLVVSSLPIFFLCVCAFYVLLCFFQFLVLRFFVAIFCLMCVFLCVCVYVCFLLALWAQSWFRFAV